MDARRRTISGSIQNKNNSGGGSGDGDIITDNYNYMTIYALEDGLQAKLSGTTVSYSIDEGNTWNELVSDTYTPTVNSGETIMFKGRLKSNSSGANSIFTINKRCNLMGNCMSLLFGDNAASNNSLSGEYYAFRGLFKGCTTIVEVSSTFLPATTLADNCYEWMFSGCTSLVTAPELPATYLYSGCYDSMFAGCTSLVIAPELPATTLATDCYDSIFYGCSGLTTAPELPATYLYRGCYGSMFKGCTSLVTAPELPATTLASSCYYQMFQGCSSLVTAPELPATTLASSCYYYMFRNCSKLNYIKMLATDVSADYCLTNWVSGVSSTGTFVKNPAMTSLPTGDSGIPSGWTVLNDGEEPEQESPQVAGDVAYYTNGEIKTISASNWSSSLGTPIGVVVIPSNFLPDGKARIVSLKAVNSSGNASTSHSGMHWEQSGSYVNTTLTNYTKVPITNNTGSVSSSSNSYGYLPSDNFTGDTSFVDSNAKYYNTNTNKIPSPYNGSEFNTDYSKTIGGYNNALSDFNGLSNTQVLVGLGSDYVAANAAWNYSDGVSNTQWYLPSASELGFLVARFKTINSTISMLSGVAVPSHYFWSSTEYSSINAYDLNTRNGYVYDGIKDSSSYVRPFASLDNEDPNLSTFTINGIEYQAEEGMTWGEWVASEYNNTDPYSYNIYGVNNNVSIVYDAGAHCYVQLNGINVLISDEIVDTSYTIIPYDDINGEPPPF